MIHLHGLKFSYVCADSGRFSVDRLLEDRGIEIVPSMTAVIDKDDLRRDNPDFIIDCKENTVVYERDSTTHQRPDSIIVTVSFNEPVTWFTVNH